MISLSLLSAQHGDSNLLYLRDQVLVAGSLRVVDIINRKLIDGGPDSMPMPIAACLSEMEVEWIDNRTWGLSFQFGDAAVRLGHRMGDHLATRPDIYGMSDYAAAELLRLQLEGVILHETGHAVLDKVLQGVNDPDALWDQLIVEMHDEPPISTYTGHSANMSERDILHEIFAESFKYTVLDKQLAITHPKTCSMVMQVTETASQFIAHP